MANVKRIGVLLSGCGVKDGSEIHEAVLTLLAIDRAGAAWVAIAPDIDQGDVVNHATGQTAAGREKRSVLAESARISRGEILSIDEVDAKSLDGLVLPGGFGAAKNLSDFAARGQQCTVHPAVADLIQKMWRAEKPIGAWCIAPAILAKVLGEAHPTLTIGTDAPTAQALEAMGARHENRPATGVVVDTANRLVTTPCYMSAQRISEVADGIQAAVGELLKLCPAARAKSA